MPLHICSINKPQLPGFFHDNYTFVPRSGTWLPRQRVAKCQYKAVLTNPCSRNMGNRIYD